MYCTVNKQNDYKDSFHLGKLKLYLSISGSIYNRDHNYCKHIKNHLYIFHVQKILK